MYEQRSGDDHEAEPSFHHGPRIYAASLSDYNAGRLHGAWIRAAQEPDALLADVRAMLEDAPTTGAEEWAIHDYEGFGDLRISEYAPFETVAWYANGIEEHGLAFAAWIAHTGYEPHDDADFEEAYEGEWPSIEGYVAAYLEDTGLQAALEQAVPASLAPYARIDVDALARDLVLGGELFTANAPASNSIWIFRSI